MDVTTWSFWTRCPMKVALVYGKYLVTLASISPGHDE